MSAWTCTGQTTRKGVQRGQGQQANRQESKGTQTSAGDKHENQLDHARPQQSHANSGQTRKITMHAGVHPMQLRAMKTLAFPPDTFNLPASCTTLLAPPSYFQRH